MQIRIYFNRMADMPYIWSFDRGTQLTEVTVTGFTVHEGLTVASGLDESVPVGDTERPRVWINVFQVHRFELTERGTVHLYAKE